MTSEDAHRRKIPAAVFGLLGLVLILIAGFFIWWEFKPRQATTPVAEKSNGPTPDVTGDSTAPKLVKFSLDEVGESTPADRFVTALLTDTRGCLWAASEGGGIRRFDPTGKTGERWTHYTVVDGLGDQNVYALAEDRKGRIWAGHLNHGVSVFNGESWQNFDVVSAADRSTSLAGPLGERVFCIRVSPTDGDVWMATNAGLTRYSESADKWTYFTHADGLPSDAVDCIDFDGQGNIFVGTQTDGLAIANVSDQYHQWRIVTGPTALTTTATGHGLPTNRMNDVMVTRDQTVYVATPCGLAWSIDHGKSWAFAHGPDWALRWTNSETGPPANWNPPTGFLIEDDSITSLAQDNLGAIYLGFSHHGVGKYTRDEDGTPQHDLQGDNSDNKEMVRALPPDMGRYPVAGTYGQAVLPIGDEGTLPATIPDLKTVAMPAAATTPELSQLAAEIPTTPEEKSDFIALPLDDDWRTQGTWVGRVGRDWACLCAMDPFEYRWGAGRQMEQFNMMIGSHRHENDGARYWIATNYTKDVRALEIPPVYMDSRLKQKLTTPEVNRRIGNVNDNGETYPRAWEGPNLYTIMSIPEGTFILSVYEMNDDGHQGATALRDFSMQISADPGNGKLNGDIAPIAAERVTSFYYGVYKRFLVTGPHACSLIVRKNESLNAMTSAFMLDQPTDMPEPYFADQSARPPMTDSPAAKIDLALRTLSTTNPRWWAINHRRMAVMLTRWCQSVPVSPETSWQLAGACYFAGLYPQLEKTQELLGLRSARSIEKSLTWQQKWPDNSGEEARDLNDYLHQQKKAP